MKIGKLNNIYILTKQKFFKIYEFNNKKIIFIDNLSSLENKGIFSEDILISCNTNIIVPTKIFDNFKLALNIHPGSYNFPGRDPHHWACYSKSKTFGSTAHLMQKEVDSGEIIDYELIKVHDELSVIEYKNIGVISSKILIKRLINGILKGFIKVKKGKWEGRVTKRADLIKLCNFKNLDEKEIKRREHSFAGFEKLYRY